MDYTFYCNCYKDHENEFTQFNQKNLMCGSYYFDEIYKKELREKGFLFDDEGDNISHLNPWFGDLTGLYWIWKNTNDEIVGTNQYRRPWIEEDFKKIEFNENTLYVAAPAYTIIEENGVNRNINAYDQLCYLYGNISLLIVCEAISHKKIPFTIDDIDTLKNRDSISPCNMFFGHRKVFNKVCSLLFDTMFEIYNGSKYALPYLYPDFKTQTFKQVRLMAFISERILTMIYDKGDTLLPGIKIMTVDWENLHDRPERNK